MVSKRQELEMYLRSGEVRFYWHCRRLIGILGLGRFTCVTTKCLKRYPSNLSYPSPQTSTFSRPGSHTSYTKEQFSYSNQSISTSTFSPSDFSSSFACHQVLQTNPLSTLNKYQKLKTISSHTSHDHGCSNLCG